METTADVTILQEAIVGTTPLCDDLANPAPGCINPADAASVKWDSCVVGDRINVYDAIVLADAPDNVSAAAVSLAASASGLVRVTTTPLLTIEETDQARELVSKIPAGGGLVSKGLISLAGTFVVGKGLDTFMRLGRGLTREEKQRMYDQAIERDTQGPTHIIDVDAELGCPLPVDIDREFLPDLLRRVFQVSQPRRVL